MEFLKSLSSRKNINLIDAHNYLCDKILRALADTDVFIHSKSTRIFIVYAHNGMAGDAMAKVVRHLADCLTKTRSQVVSDMAALPWWGPREGGDEAARNILSNQLCLLPPIYSSSDNSSVMSSVDKVVLCGSEVLRQYCEHNSGSSYMEEIDAVYRSMVAQRAPSEEIKNKIRSVVESYCQDDWFHHVLTEIALLKIRRASCGKNSHGIIPISLDGSGMDYLPFIDNCDLWLKLKSSSSIDPTHRLFFDLLLQLYTDQHVLISHFSKCYDDAISDFQHRGRMTETEWEYVVLQRIIGAQEAMKDHNSAFIRNNEWIKQHEKSVNRDVVFEWLPKIEEVIATQREHLQQRHTGTGTWILENETYKKWKSSSPWKELPQGAQCGRLWCYGKPGAGKSIISSGIIEDLQSTTGDQSSATAYVFCQNAEGQTAGSLLLSLISQLIHLKYELSAELIKLLDLDKGNASNRKPNVSECTQVLSSQILMWDRVFIVVDALDERLDNDYAFELLSALLCTKANVLVTSRRIASIGQYMEGSEKIEIKARSNDVELYLDAQFSENFRLRKLARDNPSLQSKVVKTIVSNAGDMFLIAKLQMSLLIQVLKKNPTAQSLINALQMLPSSLEAVYDEYLERILASDSSDTAREILTWILFAKQPVGMKLVGDAISLLQHNALGNDYCISEDMLLGFGFGLVEQHPETQTLAFMHISAQEYFQRPDVWARICDGQASMAKSCLRCLLLTPRADSPLWSYAAKYWGHHVEEDSYCELQGLILNYLRQSSKVTSAMRHMAEESPPMPNSNYVRLSMSHSPNDFYSLYQHEPPTTSYGSHAAAFFGLWQYFTASTHGDAECRDSNHWTPLWWAVLGRQDKTVKLLLDNGANASAKSINDIPLTIWMLDLPNKKTLLSKSLAKIPDPLNPGGVFHSTYQLPSVISFEISQPLGQRALSPATETSMLAIVDSIHGDALNVRDNDGNTILMIAAKLWLWHVVRRLVNHGADVALRNKRGETAFRLALLNNARELFSDLSWYTTGDIRAHLGPIIALEHNATLNPYNFHMFERTIEDMIVQLIPNNLAVHGDEGAQMLCLAISYRHSRVVAALLAMGVSANIQYTNGVTPLILSCSNQTNNYLQKKFHFYGSTTLSVGIYLVQISSKHSISDNFAYVTETSPEAQQESDISLTPFDSIVAMLIENGADIEAINDRGESALSLAAQNKYLTLCRTLLNHGADIRKVSESDLEDLRGQLRKQSCEPSSSADMLNGVLRDFETHDYCNLLLSFAFQKLKINAAFLSIVGNGSIYLYDDIDIKNLEINGNTAIHMFNNNNIKKSAINGNCAVKMAINNHIEGLSVNGDATIDMFSKNSVERTKINGNTAIRMLDDNNIDRIIVNGDTTLKWESDNAIRNFTFRGAATFDEFKNSNKEELNVGDYIDSHSGITNIIYDTREAGFNGSDENAERSLQDSRSIYRSDNSLAEHPVGGGSYFEFKLNQNVPVRFYLSSNSGSGNSCNDWTAQREYEQRILMTERNEAKELLAMIEDAVREASKTADIP